MLNNKRKCVIHEITQVVYFLKLTFVHLRNH